jgi:hypothetical protein
MISSTSGREIWTLERSSRKKRLVASREGCLKNQNFEVPIKATAIYFGVHFAPEKLLMHRPSKHSIPFHTYNNR